jgi:hypothetical protein
MQKRIWIAPLAIAAIVAGVSLYSKEHSSKLTGAPGAIAFRIVLGVDDKESTAWDGSVTVTPGKVTSIQGYRFTDGDSTDSKSSWKVSTRRSVGAGAAAKAKAKAPERVLDNGVLVAVSGEDPAARIDIKTTQGAFSFRAQEVPFGVEKEFLNGRALVDRVPVTLQLTTSEEEQDFPAIAQSGDSVYVSYVEFVHGDRSLELARQLTKAPEDFDSLARPVGGDQVFLLTYSKSKRTWSEPVAVSAPKRDVMRTAVAVDGQKRVWVFWSANKDGNFDIYAKSFAAGHWSSEMRLTSDPGTDLNPVAAADAKGRVWVAWQGFRKNNLEILAAAQEGDKFSKETVVSFSPASDWDPAIATAPNGEVAVSWDTYDKGDYDVYFRRLKMAGAIHMDAPVPVAASRNFEARSSIAYDPQSRLWVAYETSTTKWGKDFGAYESSGVSLYQDHDVRVKCFQGTEAFTTAADLQSRLPGSPFAVARKGVRKAKEASLPLVLPDPDLAKNRPPNGNTLQPPSPLNSFPRLAVDPSGTVYLSFRAASQSRTGLGSVWQSQILYFDGTSWRGPVVVPNTDYWMDMRAAMAAVAPGSLMMVSASDHRFGGTTVGGRAPAASSQFNSDLYAAELRLDKGARSPQLKPVAAEKVAAPDPDAAVERAQKAMIRKYRATAGSGQVQLMRGEFHRHTEFSSDGGRDGPIIDAYRYFIDAASMDWGGCCDHDNGGGREYSWWISQKLTDAYHLGTNFVPMFSYERSVNYPEGHRNIVFSKRGIRTLPRLPISDPDKSAPAPDTQMLYRYLRKFDGIVASHTSGTNMGTDWRDNDPVLEPVVEIYQGDRQNYEIPNGPRSNNAEDSIGGWRPLGFVSLALKKGYRLGFQASSDHVSTHMSYCNLWVTTPTREGIMEAFHKRRVYGATDDILADVRCGGHFMGEEFETSEPPAISVKLWGLAPFAKVHIIKDGEYVYTAAPGTKNVDFVWKDNTPQKGKTSYYYVRGEQSDGELVWVSPMWITYR